MQIKDFFKEHKRHKVSDADKLLIFEKIVQHQNKRQRNLLLRAHKVKLKAFAGTFVLALLALTFYGTYYNTPTDTGNGYSITSTNHQEVFADRIGTIISAEGYFEITNNGRKIIADHINDKDIITLDEASSLGIRVSETIQAKVVGPAKFSVHFVGQKDGVNQYRIKMIEGDFVAIHGVVSDQDQEEIEIETTDGVLIKQEKSEKAEEANYVVTRKANKPVVVNNGSSKLTVAQKDSKKTTEITDKTVARIDTENQTLETASLETTVSNEATQEEAEILAELGDIIAEAEQQHQEIASNSGTGGISTGVLANATGGTDSPVTVAVIDEPEEEKEDLEEPVIINGKFVISKDKLQQIKQSTQATFMTNNMKKIMTYHLLGQEQKLAVSRSQYLDRLNKIYDAIESENPYKSTDIQSLLASTETLIDTLRTSYIVSNDVLWNLGAARNWLMEIQQVEYALLQDTEDTNFEALLAEANINQGSHLQFR